MHAHLLEIIRPGCNIGLCGESDQSLLIHIQPQRIRACHKHIDSQIELQALNQKWFVEVSLDNTPIPIFDS